MPISSNLMSLMIVVAATITTATFFYLQYGLLLLIPFAVVAILAFTLWMITAFKFTPLADKFIITYALAIIGLTIINSLRVLTGVASIGGTIFSGVFLCSGYYIIKRVSLGYYVLSFLYIWCIFQGLLQFYMAGVVNTEYTIYHYAAIGTGIVILFIGLFGTYQLLTYHKNKVTTTASITYQDLTPRQLNLYTAFILNLTIFYLVIIIFSTQLHPNPDSFIFCISTLVGIYIWRKTTVYCQINMYKVIPFYCLTLGLLMFHWQEENLFQFADRAAILLNANLPDPIISIIMPILMIYGIIGLWLRQPLSSLIVWIVSINVILSQPLHFLFYPVVEAIHTKRTYSYFPGMWSALWPMIPAIGIITTMIHEYNKAKANCFIKS